MTVFPLYPTRAQTASDLMPPCPDCGRYGGAPHVAHGAGAEPGTPDTSLAGLRCTAEALVGLVESMGTTLYGAGDETEAHALALALSEGIARLDYLAGGEPE